MSSDNSNLIPFFVVGLTRTGGDGVVVRLDPSPTGWAQRVVHGEGHSELNVDYVSGEVRKDLNEWFVCDFRTKFHRQFTFEEDAMAYLEIL